MAKQRDTFYGLRGGPFTGTEINLRQEMIKTMDGMWPEISKAQPGLLRTMRRDSSFNLIQCPCVDKVTKEPDKDRWCPSCHGEGYMWDETPMQLYRTLSGLHTTNALRDRLTSPGLINIPLVVFYIRYDSVITRQDRIIELVLDDAGDAVLPMKRKAVFIPASVWDYRSDNGKLEYWVAYCHEETRKFINAPFYNGV